MTITTDILRIWRHPRAVIRGKLAAGEREDRALAVLMAASLFLFVAQWPSLSRAAFLDPTTPLEARLGGALLACLFILPLLAYGLALISHLIARAIGGSGTGFGARLALFWAMLAISPAMLLQGLTAGFVGPSPALYLVQGIVTIGFIWMWIAMLVEVEQGRGD